MYPEDVKKSELFYLGWTVILLNLYFLGQWSIYICIWIELSNLGHCHQLNTCAYLIIQAFVQKECRLTSYSVKEITHTLMFWLDHVYFLFFFLMLFLFSSWGRSVIPLKPVCSCCNFLCCKCSLILIPVKHKLNIHNHSYIFTIVCYFICSRSVLLTLCMPISMSDIPYMSLLTTFKYPVTLAPCQLWRSSNFKSSVVENWWSTLLTLLYFLYWWMAKQSHLHFKSFQRTIDTISSYILTSIMDYKENLHPYVNEFWYWFWWWIGAQLNLDLSHDLQVPQAFWT